MTRATVVLAVALLAAVAVGLSGQTEDGLAELHVQKIVLDPPSAVTRGEDVEIYTRITNTGERSADSFTVGFFYRPARDGEAWILLGAVTEEHLGPSQQDFLEETFEFSTAGMDLGTYEVKVVADAFRQIPEVDELNNELTTSMQLVTSTIGLPELQPIRMTFNQSGTSEMDPWAISLEVENSGEYQLSTFDVQFLLDGAPVDLAMQPAPAFLPDTGDTTTILATLDPHTLDLDPGTYLVTAEIDSSNQILEQDEGNNSLSASLTIQTLELRPQSLSFDKPVVRLDEDVRVTSEIVNLGSGLAKNVRVDFYVNHLKIATTQIDQLGVEPQEVYVTLNPSKLGLYDAPKVYETRVIVDPDNALHESDEANNELVRTLTILEPEVKKPELHPESLQLTPASPTELSTSITSVTVESVVSNTGRTPGVGFDVGFYYRLKGARLWHSFPCADVSCTNIDLDPGEQVRLVAALTLSPATLGPGIYEIRVAADAEDLVDELDEDNNELVTTLTVLGPRLADLTVSIDTVEPSSLLQVGQTARITATVTNIGEEASTETLTTFYLCKLAETTVQNTQAVCSDDPDRDYVLTVPALEIGESTTLRLDVESTELSPGQYRLQAEVNPGQIVEEKDATNNITTRAFSFQGPDLMPFETTFEANPSGTIDQRTVSEVDFSVTIANIGPLAAGDFDVMFGLLRMENGVPTAVPMPHCGDDPTQPCADLDYFGRVDVTGIGAGEQLGVGCTLDLEDADLEPGQYIVQVYVDRVLASILVLLDEGQVEETSELNNVAELPLVIVGEPDGPDPYQGTGEGADLSVISVNGRATEDTILAYGIVKNVGEDPSQVAKAIFTVTLPNGYQLRGSPPSIPSLAPGEVDGVNGWLSVTFLQGVDDYFDEPLPVGESVHIELALEMARPDANTTNDLRSRTITVRE